VQALPQNPHFAQEKKRGGNRLRAKKSRGM
jgi:hypothetical protein